MSGTFGGSGRGRRVGRVRARHPATEKGPGPLVGTWTYRSFINDPDPAKPFNDLQFAVAEVTIQEAEFGKSGVGSSFLPAGGNPVSVHHSCPKRRTDIAPRSSGEEDSRSLKPFRWNPAGNQSRPVEPDQQPEASLAWWVGDHPCEA